MEGPRHQHLHQEWQEPLEERRICGEDTKNSDKNSGSVTRRG